LILTFKADKYGSINNYYTENRNLWGYAVSCDACGCSPNNSRSARDEDSFFLEDEITCEADIKDFKAAEDL
jgi:hypothetical protein